MITTSDDLVTKILSRCFWPADGTAPLSTAEILSIVDEEIEGELWPAVILSHGDYYTLAQDPAITVDLRRYRLPPNAYGPIRGVAYVDEDGEETPLPLMDLNDIGRPAIRGRGAALYRYYIDGDFIGLDPMPTATQGTLRIRYYRRPNKLTLLENTWRITALALSGASPTITVELQGSAEIGNSDVIDVITSGNAHSVLCENSAILMAPAAVDGVQTVYITDASAAALTAANVAVGDYVALAGYTPAVPLPDFMVPALVRGSAAACFRADGDHASADREDQAASRLLENAKSLLVPRTEAQSPTVGCRNSPLRMMGG